MERKNSIKMNKLILSCLSIFALCNAGYSQTYIYDKNLKASKNLIAEANYVKLYKVYSSDDIISEFRSNSIRAENLFKNKIIIIKGRIALITKIDNFNIIGFDISENEYQKKYMYVGIEDTNKYSKIHNFDKITNYSVGDWVNILGLYLRLDENGSRLFSGEILHTENINNPKKNLLVKVVNVPSNVSLSYENDDSNPWATKFSDVENGKSFCKIFSTYEYVILNITFKDINGNIIKKKTVQAKTNCHSIFDYNKL